MTHISAPEDVDALWLHLLQRAMGRAAHDLKDALNGVSVNLEVIRARAERAETPASAVAQFAEAAGNQLERLTTLLDAVLTLSRAEREQVDVGFTLRRIAIVCSASNTTADAAVTVTESGVLDSAASRLDGCAVRVALMAPLLEATTGSDRSRRASEVLCTLRSDAEAIMVDMSADGRHVTMPEQVAESLRAAGIRWVEDGRTLTLTFLRA